VARLLALPESRLRYWTRVGFVPPSVHSGRRRFYTFQDLIALRAAKELLASGVPFGRVRRSVEALREALPKVVRPLAELRVVADGAAVVVQDEQGAYEPTTMQAVLDFRVESLREDVVRVLRRPPAGEEARRSAYERYLEGCRLDEDEATVERAEEAYVEALRLDPSLANALTNLGNIHYRRDDVDEVERFYRHALAVDPEQPEAHYNLGFLRLEEGEGELARSEFEAALDVDPAFADAHFNLALTLELLGQAEEAQAHFRVYLELCPDTEWSEEARRHLS
jgi:tetratricopeptide (TPR) repeat protein